MKPLDAHTLVRFKRAFNSIRGELEHVNLAEAPAINVDVPVAAEVVLGSVSRLKRYRPALAKLGRYDITQVRKLKVYAEALLYAHDRYTRSDVAFDSTGALRRELAAMRETLIDCTRPLVARKLMDASKMPRLAGGAGLEKLASQITWISELYRASWPSIVNRTSVTIDELNYDLMCANRICTSLRMHQELALAAAETRRRAFCLMIAAYSEARRGIKFLRWNEGDSESITPSLYATQAGRKRQPHG